MIDPWRYVDADDDLVADLLAGTIELVLEVGGWLHPNARVVARAGHLHIRCEADDGEPLIRLPSAAFVPVGRIRWSESRDALEAVEVPPLTGTQHELLILQTALHNTCGKVPWLVRAHPVLSSRLPETTVQAVRAFRPSFRLRQPTPASLLWSTRAFRIPAHESAPPEPMALPLVDLLDHRAGGATGTWTGDAFTVDVARASDDAHSWLDYGLTRDAVGMAVVYGFADTSNPVAHSAPLTVAVPGVGSVTVLATGRTRSGELLSPVVTEEADGRVVSHVTFHADDPGIAARALATAGGWTTGQAVAASTAIARANVALAQAVIASTDGSQDEAAAVLAGAAERQVEVLSAAAR